MRHYLLTTISAVIALMMGLVAPMAVAMDKAQMSGKVKFFNNEKGLGFITRSTGNDVFIHTDGLDKTTDGKFIFRKKHNQALANFMKEHPGLLFTVTSKGADIHLMSGKKTIGFARVVKAADKNNKLVMVCPLEHKLVINTAAMLKLKKVRDQLAGNYITKVPGDAVQKQKGLDAKVKIQIVDLNKARH